MVGLHSRSWHWCCPPTPASGCHLQGGPDFGRNMDVGNGGCLAEDKNANIKSPWTFCKWKWSPRRSRPPSTQSMWCRHSWEKAQISDQIVLQIIPPQIMSVEIKSCASLGICQKMKEHKTFCPDGYYVCKMYEYWQKFCPGGGFRVDLVVCEFWSFFFMVLDGFRKF